MKVTIMYNNPDDWISLYYNGKEYLGMNHLSIYRQITNKDKFINDNRRNYGKIVDCEISSITMDAIRKEVPEIFL